MINVTKTFLPPFEEYTSVLKRAWDKRWITNNGELVQELEQKLKEYLQINNLLFCSNGTVVLQMALKALNITKEVITTPFSYVATTNAILWENCTPVFVDINPDTFCIDASKIEASVTENTQAILATHVYGFPCDVEKIEEIANKYNLKVIYDAAHAFGCTYKGKSLLDFGDISTCSFHATKIFHTVEGGCITARNKEVFDQLHLYRQFGHVYDDYFSQGINAKNSELHAAMGLCVLPRMGEILQKRKQLYENYEALLDLPQRPIISVKEFSYNYSYFPVVFDNEQDLLTVKKALEGKQIFSRRYFYPSLNTLPFISYQPKPESESIASRVLCLPLFNDLSDHDQEVISEIVMLNKPVYIC
ncbi:MAG TPA: DegT/DnrJ/EryC1/StrS family aminotransferase [Parafilimonas sp.]|nr:DegT/DnrJ/EryC1/StrS family aminotransferase [Parafilimonas sp.]